ncbi:hypothetical protein GCM10028820_34560 [Tessaracoccus terricola]
MPLSEVLWSSLTIIVSLVGSWLVARWTLRAQRATSAHAAAIDRLLPSLARLRALLHESSVRNWDSEDVAAAVNEFESLCMQHASALPPGIRSVRFDVRAALGNYFGGVSLASLDASMANLPLAEPRPYWRAISVSYLEYAMTTLQQSLVQPRAAPMVHFSDWRRDEDEFHR